METTKSAVKLCSKCKKYPRADQEGTNPWCLKCRCAYQVEYDRGAVERATKRGYAEGSRAMRDVIEGKFRGFLHAQFSAPEVAEIVRRVHIDLPLD